MTEESTNRTWSKKARLPWTFVVATSFFVALVVPDRLQSQQPTTVILVRHAEKVDDPGNRDPELSEAGRNRAGLLAQMLQDAGITRIYSTPFKRTLDTARPLSAALGVEIVETPITPTFVSDLAGMLATGHEGETILVVGHSNTTPDVANALAGSHFEQFDESDYTNILVVTLPRNGNAAALKLRFGM